MVSIIPKSAKLNIVGGAAGYATKTLKLMLLNASYVPLTSHDFIDDIRANEITDLGGVYTAGGITLAGKVGVQHGDNAYLDANDVSIGPGATIAYRYGAIYVSTGVDATSEILAIIDFGATQSVTSGTSTIQWNALGIIYFQ